MDNYNEDLDFDDNHLQIDENQEEYDEQELPISLESCILLNNAYQELLDEFADNLKLRITHNAMRRKDLEDNLNLGVAKPTASGPSHPNSLIPFMAPYFKDVKGLSAPTNMDVTLKQRNGEINQAYIYPSKPWNKNEKEQLKDLIMQFFKEKQIENLIKDKETLTKSTLRSRNSNKMNVDEKIKQIDNKVNAIVKKPTETFVPPRNYESLDWLRISAQLDAPHNHHECEIFWNNMLHPSINQGTWLKKEDEQLKNLVEKYGTHNWELIASKLGTNRAAWQCCQRYQSELNSEMHRTGPLTKGEAEMVEKLIASCRIGDYIPWHQIGYFIEGRTLSQIKHYWNKINVPKRGNLWDEFEDKVLVAAVKKYGTHNWRKIAFYIPGRSNRQCRERFMMRLNFPERKLGNWTEEEDKQIIQLAKEYNCSWVKIEQKMKGRNARQIASRYDLLSKNLTENDDNEPPKIKTRSMKIQSKLYDRIKLIVNRYNANKQNDEIERFLRSGREKLLQRLKMDLNANEKDEGDSYGKGRRKKPKKESEIDEQIIELFNYFTLTNDNKKASSVQTSEDQTVYNYAKNAVISLFKGQQPNQSDLLGRVIKESLSRRITHFESTSSAIPLPIFPPNRETVQGLKGLMLQRDYLTRKIAASESDPFIDINADDYKLLSTRFTSLFAWPALLSLIEPPINDNNTQSNEVKEKSGQKLKWLTTSSTRMIEIRSQQKKLIESAIQKTQENDDDEQDDNDVELNESSSKTPWYLLPRERRYYKPKSLDKKSFVFTRIKPSRKAPEELCELRRSKRLKKEKE